MVFSQFKKFTIENTRGDAKENPDSLEMTMKKWSLLALIVSLVVVGMNFLMPAAQEAVEQPGIRFVAHGTTPAPVDYLSSTFTQDSSSTLEDLVSVFQNISDEPVTAIKVSWTIHGQSGRKMSATVTMDALPFGDEDFMGGEPFLPGSTIEVPGEATITMTAPIERIEVKLDFVETSGVRKPGIEWPNYGKVWPSRSESWRNMVGKRRLVATFRSFLVREADSKGPGRIEEILQMERDRRAKMAPHVSSSPQ